MTYSEKLTDPRWQKIRLQIFERDGFRCRLCSDSKTTLHVHHSYYQSGNDPWDYPLDSLKSYCKFCHAIVESFKKTGLTEIAAVRIPDTHFFFVVVNDMTANDSAVMVVWYNSVVSEAQTLLRINSSSLDSLTNILKLSQNYKNG